MTDEREIRLHQGPDGPYLVRLRLTPEQHMDLLTFIHCEERYMALGDPEHPMRVTLRYVLERLNGAKREETAANKRARKSRQSAEYVRHMRAHMERERNA